MPQFAPYDYSPFAGLGNALEGAAEGQIQGQALAQRFAHDQMLNALRALQMQQGAAQLQQQMLPKTTIHGDRQLTVHPTTGQATVTELPMTASQQQLAETRGARAETAGAVADLKRMQLEQAQAGNDPKVIQGRLMQQIEKQGIESLTPGQKSLWDFYQKANKPTQNITGPLREQMVGMGIDPATATPEQVQAAQAALDKRIATRTGAEAFQRAGASDFFTQKREDRKEGREQKQAAVRGEKVLKDLDIVESRLDNMAKKGLLPPEGSTAVGMYKSKFNRELLNPSDPDWVTFKGLFGPVMIGEIDRGMFDEKGVRAIQAFRAQFDLLDHTPSVGAMRAFINTLRQSIRSKIANPNEEGAAPSVAPSGAAPSAPEVLPRSDARYKKLRERGMSDQQIEQKYGVKVQ